MNPAEKDSQKTKYLPDADIPQVIQPELSDYKDSGLEIGQMLMGKAEDHFLATASPQVPQFNKVYWVKFENYVKELVKELYLDRVAVFTGPLYLPYDEKDGKKYVTYQVIGENNIAVPTHFFKAIFYIVIKQFESVWPGETVPYPRQGRPPEDYAKISEGIKVVVETYIIPNTNIPQDTPVSSFRTTIQDLEKKSGIVFPQDFYSYFVVRKTGPIPF